MPRTFNCHKCDLSFTKKSNWERHFKNVHDRVDTTYQCPFCEKQRKNLYDMRGHLRQKHPEKKELVRANPSLIREVQLDSPSIPRARESDLDDSLGLSPAVQADLDRYVGQGDLLELAASISSVTPATATTEVLVSDGLVASSPLPIRSAVVPVSATPVMTCMPLQTSAAITGTSAEHTMLIQADKWSPPVNQAGTCTQVTVTPAPSLSATAAKQLLPDTVTAATSSRVVLDTNLDPNIPYVPGTSTMETQTGISSVEAFPKSPKYLAPTKCDRGTEMGAPKSTEMSNTSSTTTRKRPREDTCCHGIYLPVVEIQTTTVKEGTMRRKTITETVHCAQCWRSEESDSEDSDWGF